MASSEGSLRSALTMVGPAKVPAIITGVFWAAKLFSTALGETVSDWMVHDLGAGVAVVLGGLAFGLALWLQLRAIRYVPWIYWLAVSMVAIFGTLAADVLHKGVGIPYPVTTVLFASTLAVVFFVWWKVEGTLSIHSITTMRRELFYWAAVIATFALGTAAGDMAAHSFSLGYFASAVLFTAIFLIPAIGYWTGRFEAVFAFWFAYVFTRPIGASIADWLEKPKVASGVGLSYALVFGIFMIGLVVTVAIQQHRWQSSRRRHVHGHQPLTDG